MCVLYALSFEGDLVATTAPPLALSFGRLPAAYAVGQAPSAFAGGPSRNPSFSVGHAPSWRLRKATVADLGLTVRRTRGDGRLSTHLGHSEYSHGVLRVLVWGAPSTHLGWSESSRRVL
jgi:hypothetical protein